MYEIVRMKVGKVSPLASPQEIGFHYFSLYAFNEDLKVELELGRSFLQARIKIGRKWYRLGIGV